MKRSRKIRFTALRAAALLAASFMILAALVGCVANKPFQTSSPAAPAQPGGTSSMMTIEVDESGPVFGNGQSAHLLSWLRAADPSRPFVVYVHGWHHNAQTDDSNLASFRAFLGLLEAASGAPVDGLYVGWRGDAFDLPPLPEAIDFLSIWGRKAAAAEVGRNGVARILTMVRDNRGGRSLAVIGHSLGGDAVFKSIEDNIGDELADGIEYFLLNPAISEHEFAALDRELRKSAFALDFAPGLLLTTTEATRRQHRKVTVFQALGDRAVGFFYRLAFPGETPIGFHADRQTHRADVCKPGDACPVAEGPRECATRMGNSFVIRANGDTPMECNRSNRRSLWVISGAESVSRGHSDILTGIQAEALAILITRTNEERIGK